MGAEHEHVVLIRDPFPLLARGMAGVLAAQPGIRHVVVDATPAGIVTAAVDAEADLLVLGVMDEMPEWLLACSRLRRRRPRTRVILAVDSETAVDMADVVRAGIAGVVLRSACESDLATAVAGTLAGRNVVAPQVAGQLIRALSMTMARSGSRPNVGMLSAREVDVLRLVAEGLTNRDIGARLHISENTVKNHMRSVHEKLGVRSRTEAVVSAAREGLLGLASTGD